MKPLKLTIEGFKPFRTRQEIDFSTLDFFVIRGPTGSGKSSILDAIVFALFGKLEELKREDLINKNSRAALIDFTFTVKGNQFRIVRYIPRSGSAEVRFYENGKQRGWKISRINERIEELLGVNLKQFQQIFFLPQGRYDRFIKGTAAERKKILESLLDLEIYNLLAERLKEEYLKTETELQSLKTRLETMSDATPQVVEQLKKQLEKFEEEKQRLKLQIEETSRKLEKLRELARIYGELEDAEEQLRRLTGENYRKLKEEIKNLEKLEPAAELIGELSQKERLLKDTRSELSALEQNLRTKREELSKLIRELQKFEQTLKTYEENREKIERFKETVAKLDYYSKLWIELNDLKSKKEALEKQLQRVFESHSSTLKRLEKLISDREQIYRSLEQLNYNPSEEGRLAALLEKSKRKNQLLEKKKLLEQQLLEIQRQLERIKNEIQHQRSLLEEKEKRLEELYKRKTVEKLLEGLKEGDPCPVCGRPLEKKHLERFALKTDEVEGNSYETLKVEVEELKQQLSERERLLTTLLVKEENLLKLLKEIDGELKGYEGIPSPDELEEKIRELREVAKLKEQLEKRLNEVEQQMASLKAELAKLDAKKESLEEKISEIKERIAERESILTPVLEKLRSKVSIPEGVSNPFEQVKNTLRGKIERFEKEYKQLQQRLQELGNLRAALQKETELLQRRREELQRRYDELTAEVEKQREILKSYLPEGYTAEVERLKEQLKKLKELREQLHRREGEIVQLKERIEHLKTLIAQEDDYSPQVLEETEKQLKRLQERLEEVKTAGVEHLHRLKELEKLLQERKKLEEDIQQLQSRFNLLKTLRDDFRADRLQRFVVAKALNDIAEAAGYFLNKLSDGRYTFVLEEEELLVYDSHEDAIRKVQTLSGGETFLASLSFALGFGQYVGGNASVESLFIDEGFGTLDAETLGRVEEIFEIIRSKVNKTIGVITHLDALAEIFDKRVEVKRTPEGSKIEVVNAIENS